MRGPLWMMQRARSSRLRAWLNSLTFVIPALALPASAHAVSYVRSVEYVEVSLGSGVTTASTNLTKGQNPANCVPFATATGTGADNRFGRRLTDVYFETGPTRVTAQRDFGTGSTISVGIFVVEFDPAYVNVYQGTFANAQAAAQPTTSPIPAVTLGRAALVFYHRYSVDLVANTYAEFAVAGWFGSSTELNWQRDDASLGSVNGHYYVFEAKNAEFSVQPISFSMPGSATSATATLPAPVDPDKSFVIASYRTEHPDDDNEDGQFRVSLSDATTLTASRTWGGASVTNAISNIRAFVVQLGGNVRVQRGALSYGDGDTQETATIQMVRTTTAMVWNGMGFGPGAVEHAGAIAPDADSGFTRLKLASATTVQGDRGEGTCSGTPGDCNAVGTFEVVDFDPIGKMLVKSGRYQGNGSPGHAIYVGFRPDAVLVKRAGADPQVYAALATSAMPPDATKWLEDNAPGPGGGVALINDFVVSLDTNGFRVGSHVAVNETLAEYHWVAFRAAEGEMTVGTYIGNGSPTQSITGVGFQPEYVIVMPEIGGLPNGIPVSTSSTAGADTAFDFDSTLRAPNTIRALEIDGFQVGTGGILPNRPNLNAAGVTFHYVAWNAVPGRMAVGTYLGDGTPSHILDVVGFFPELVMIKQYPNATTPVTTRPWSYKPASTGVGADASLRFSASSSGSLLTNGIKALRPLGFEVGSNPRVNSDAECGGPCTYHWVAFGPHLPQANYRSIGSAPNETTGTLTATTGSPDLAGSGTQWQTNNRGRGDVITICDDPPVCTSNTDYVVRSVGSNLAMRLATGYAGPGGSGKTFTIRRQFVTLAAWEDCIDGLANGGACPYFPPISDSLVSDDRTEVGIVYKPSPFTAFPGGLVIDGSTTDATRTITLTVDPGNRHAGVAGTGVVIDNAGNGADAVLIQDHHVTVEWLEVRGGSSSAHGIVETNLDLIGGNQLVIRNNIVHDVPGDGIRISDNDANADIYDNIVYRARRGIRLNQAVVNGVVVRIVNNTVYSSTGTGGVPSGITAPAQALPGVFLINNIAHSNVAGDFEVPGRDLASRDNLSGDTSANGPPINHSPADAGINSSQAATTIFVNPTGNPADLHIRSGTDPENQGYDVWAGLGLFRNDIDNGARAGSWDIGADEAVTTTSVSLESFEATGQDGAVELAWKTGSEIDNLGFYLYRAESAGGPFARITAAPIPGPGSSPLGASYRYVDHGLVNGRTYHYLLEDFESTGKTERHGPVSATPRAGAPSPGGEPEPDPEGEHDPGGEPDPGASNDSRIAYGDPSTVSLRVLERTERGLLLELTTNGFFAEPSPDGSVRLSIPGFSEDNSPGSPALPTRRAWLEATAGRQVQLVSVRALDIATFPNLRPLPAQAREILASRDGTVEVARRRVEEGVAYGRSRLYPEQPALLLDTAFQGETKKALLELAPLRWDPSSQQLVLARTLLVRLAFTGNEPGEISQGGSRGRKYTERASHRNRGPLARLATRQRGLYALRFEELFDPHRRGLDTARLRLSRQGLPVAFHVEPNHARFGPGSTLYFLSDGASTNPYGNEAAYELELDQATGLTMLTASAAPSGATLPTYLHRLEREENLFFASQLDVENFWPWANVLASTTRTFPFEISQLAPGTEPARLDVWVIGLPGSAETDENHVRIFLNGQLVAEPTWNSRSLEILKVELSPTLLLEGTNTLAIENLGSAYSALILDRFALSYPRLGQAEAGVLEGDFSSSGAAELSGFTAMPILLDVSEASPRWLTGTECSEATCRFRAEAGRRYLAVETPLRPTVELASLGWLKSTLNQYDYLVLGPRHLLPAADPLLQHRRNQGLASLAVPVEDVFDQFGYGEPTPHAIRDFLAYAFHRWAPPAPRYVLLLGDATYDYKDFLHTGVQNQIPPFLFKSTYLWTASDSLYAAVNGSDALPDIAIGRLPASTLEEAQTLVDKILAFETAGQNLDGPVVLVSDNPDRAGDFDSDADEIASTILAPRNPSRISLAQLGTDPTRDAILDAFNQGPSLLSYIGHGGIQLWAHENIFHSSQIPSLDPQPRQPLVLTVNCLNGYFHSPYSDSLAEELVKADGKGAIAAFSPTGLSLNDSAQLFHTALLTQLTQSHHHRLGDAVLAAQAAYADSGALPELIGIYHLFGDPALRIR